VLILITLLLLIITSIGLFTFNFVLKRQNLIWLVSAFGMTTVWLSIFIWRGTLPTTVKLFSGSEFLDLLPILSVTPTSWMITLSLFAATLVFVITTSSSGLRRAPFFYWVILNAFSIINVLSANAGNMYVSIMAFGALDALELLTLSSLRTKPKQDYRFPITNFAAQTIGLFLIIVAGLLVGLNRSYASLNNLSAVASFLIILGAFFRVGIFPTPLDPNERVNQEAWQNHIYLYKFIALAVFIADLPAITLSLPIRIISWAIFAVFGVYSAWTWVTTHGAGSGSRYLIITASIFAVLDLLINARASIPALAIVVIILFSFLNLSMPRERIFTILILMVTVLSIGLPFTYSSTLWNTTHSKSLLSLILAVIYFLLLFGFIRHGFEEETDGTPTTPRNVTLIVSVALIAISILFGVWGWDGAANMGILWISIPLLAIFIAGFIAVFRSRQVLLVLINVKMPFVGSVSTALSDGFLKVITWADRSIRVFIDLITNLAEGKGALLWTVLILLIVLLSLQGGA